MSQNSGGGSITPYGGGFLQAFGDRIRLIIRLVADSRVNPLIKVLPIASITYLIFPDIMPGPIDDAVLLWLSNYLFVELCPPDVVDELEEDIRRRSAPKVIDPAQSNPAESDVIEAEYQEINKDNPE